MHDVATADHEHGVDSSEEHFDAGRVVAVNRDFGIEFSMVSMRRMLDINA